MPSPTDELGKAVQDMWLIRKRVHMVIMQSPLIATDQKDALVKAFDKCYYGLGDALSRGKGKIPRTKVQQQNADRRVKDVIQ